MARKNIFELLSEKWNFLDELARLRRLFDEDDVILAYSTSHTLKHFVDYYCFEDWKNRGRYIDMDDYLEALNFEALCRTATKDIECFLTAIEIMYNFYYVAYTTISGNNDNFKYYSTLITLRDNMDICLEHYNYHALYFDDKQQVIVSEKDPAATAAAEISDSETAFQIIRYNHHSLRGDIIAKKRILLHFAAELEPKRSMLNRINKAISDDIFTLLNNLNLRHNNCDTKSKDYIQYVAEMSEELLEEWYDDLYQMILLAILELDNLERKRKIAELKTHF